VPADLQIQSGERNGAAAEPLADVFEAYEGDYGFLRLRPTPLLTNCSV
jgi:hypothetical protein